MTHAKSTALQAPVPDLLWNPEAGGADSSMARFATWCADRHGLDFADYSELWAWSVGDLPQFWSDIAEYFDIAQDVAPQDVLATADMPGAKWFPSLEINFAEHVFRAFQPNDIAVISTTESGATTETTAEELFAQVAGFGSTLRALGVQPGDRVAGYLPNTLPTIVAFLGTISLGAVWTVCAPDFGVGSVLDRIAQTRPKVFVAADGYHFAGKRHDRTEAALEILAGLPSVEECVWVDYLNPGIQPDGTLDWQSCVTTTEALEFAQLPFDHPLWILFSSGTTGIPKGIVHGHGGMLIEQYKMMSLHTGLSSGDRFFWFTSTAWMMWNVVVSSMLTGATAVVFDGSPTHPGLGAQWEMAERLQITHFGSSAGYLTACAKEDLRPGESFDLARIKFIGSTGSPLPASTARWVYEAISESAQLVSSTGGTDVATGFLGGSPMLPVYAGEMSGPMLGVAVDSWDETGTPVRNEEGELVVTAPMPSMPVYFWDDEDGSRYRESYFSTFPGVWRHGDWLEITDRGTGIVSGRSDSTLNRGGVRMGTGDVYAVLDRKSEIDDCIMIGVEQADGSYWMPLFVRLAEGVALTESLRNEISEDIASNVSRRHVPDEIIAAPAIPHTKTGKRIEVPLKRLFQGVPVNRALNAGSLDQPQSITFFVELATTRLQDQGNV